MQQHNKRQARPFMAEPVTNGRQQHVDLAFVLDLFGVLDIGTNAGGD